MMMEPWMVFALLAAAGVGLAIGYVWGQRQDDALEKQKQAEEELEAYKTEVAAHFGKTAELFDKLTHDYREVYEHLAESSENLCGNQVPRISADKPEGKLLADEKDEQRPTVTVESSAKPVEPAEPAPVEQPATPESAKPKPAAKKKEKPAAAAKAPGTKTTTAKSEAQPTSWKSPVVAPPAAEAVDPDIMADPDEESSENKEKPPA